MAKYNYYVVYPGWEPGIYQDYDRAAAASKGHSGDVGNRKGCYTWEEAVELYKIRSGELPDPRFVEFGNTWVKDLDVSQIRFQELNLSAAPGISAADRTHRHSGEDYAVDGLNSQAIGRWGELYAIRVLFKKFDGQFEDSPDGKFEETARGYTYTIGGDLAFELVWHNKERESNQSPDIWVCAKGSETFWEVKTTTGNEREGFELTPAEKEFAISKGESYFIIRVIQAGTSRAEAIIYSNPFIIPAQTEPALIKAVEPVLSVARPATAPPATTPRQAEVSQKIAFQFYEGIGRRKCSTARVRFVPQGAGVLTVNQKPLATYFVRAGDAEKAVAPLTAAQLSQKCDITVVTRGGGQSGQVEATRLGLARALILYNPDLRRLFRKQGWLTRDPRVKERKKPGLKRARKAPTYTKR